MLSNATDLLLVRAVVFLPVCSSRDRLPQALITRKLRSPTPLQTSLRLFLSRVPFDIFQKMAARSLRFYTKRFLSFLIIDFKI